MSALFAPWATPLADRLVRTRADRLLDVACGTGVLARELARRTAAEQVVGCDRNAGMLEVARAVAPALRWVECPAERLAFSDNEGYQALTELLGRTCGVARRPRPS